MRKFLIIIITVILTISVGCQANKPPGNEAAPPTDKIEKTERAPQTAPEPKRDLNKEEIAHRLARIAANVPQVNDATVIVFGRYAIVGIDVDAGLDRSRVGVIKYSVAEALKEDPLGVNTLVTSDIDIVQRLREINQDIRNGRPIRGFVEELSDITGRLMLQPSKSVERKENQEDLNQRRIKPH